MVSDSGPYELMPFANKNVVLGVCVLNSYIHPLPMYWLTTTSFFNHNPEAYSALIRLFTNEGTPKSYSKLNYFGVNTYTFTKETPVRTIPTLRMIFC